MPAAFKVKGKSAIVTGAGSGINLSFAALLLSKGCNVLIADLALRPEAAELVTEYSAHDSDKPRAIFVHTDVTSWPALENLFKVGSAEFGRIDIVCPGAGIFEPTWSSFWVPPNLSKTTSTDTEDASNSAQSKDSATGEPGTYRTLDVNITHPIRLTQLAIGHFSALKPEGTGDSQPAQACGSIVLISSVAGQQAAPFVPLYFASKHAINGFVWSLAGLEEACGIRVTAVAPGIVRTPIWDTERDMALANPEDICVPPERIAETMVRLVEEEENVGGTILEVGQKVRRVQQYMDPGPALEQGLTLFGSGPAIESKRIFEMINDGRFRP